MITGQAAICTGLIARDIGGLADHDATNASALLALAVSNLARGRSRTAAIGSGLIRRDVFGTGHVLTGTGLIARHFLGATHFITRDPVAMGCGRDTNLRWCCLFRCGLTEGLEDFSTEVLSTSDRTASAGFVTGGLHRAIGLGTGDNLSSGSLTFTHFPMGIGSLLGAMTVGSRRTRDPGALFRTRTRLGTQFTNLLREFTAGEIWIGLAGHCCSTRGLFASGFSMLRHGITTRQNQSATGIFNRTTLWSDLAPLAGASTQLNVGCSTRWRCR